MCTDRCCNVLALLYLLGIVDPMSVRMKLTHSKTASRRAHHHTGAPHLVATKTGVRRRHFIDPDTGMYRGKQIITIGQPEKEKSSGKAKKQSKDKKEVTETKEVKAVTKNAKAGEEK
jgi:ribosomal protein L32